MIKAQRRDRRTPTCTGTIGRVGPCITPGIDLVEKNKPHGEAFEESDSKRVYIVKVSHRRPFPSAVALYEQAVQCDLEGVVIKDTRSGYVHGLTRTRNWLKVKTRSAAPRRKRRQESWAH